MLKTSDSEREPLPLFSQLVAVRQLGGLSGWKGIAMENEIEDLVRRLVRLEDELERKLEAQRDQFRYRVKRAALSLKIASTANTSC